ncbi:hypothetical protein [Haladaptatus sp. DFWS20]|uniref:hypothetical protein n=1 Tax=Haladaptatus sp. DFWS20 TaxID=3403467 RepID=UPI003EB7B3C9
MNAVDSIALVAPASHCGADAVQGMRGRLADLGTSADAVIANRENGEHPLEETTTIPASDAMSVEAVPSSAPALDTSFSPDSNAERASSMFRSAEILSISGRS